MSDKNPRQIAARVLRQRINGTDYVEKLLESEFAAVALDPADRRLCQELVYGVTRRRRTLDWLIDCKTDGRAQKPGLRILLQLGLYQIFWLDRIPPHAAVGAAYPVTESSGSE